MKTKTVATFDEGPAAFERFRQAVKTIIFVPKSAIADKKRTVKKKRGKRA
jgi:hypothetical protein